MCGRLNVIDDIGVQQLCEQLNIQLWSEPLQTGRFKRATDKVTIVREKAGITQADSAIWWLLLDNHTEGFKPSKYTSFNTRYDKLNVPRSAGFVPFKESRCIIPAKGFGETEFVNKKPIHYYDFEAENRQAIALGGLYKEWLNVNTGETALSCSIITLPPHEKIKHIHSKAMPLILPQNKDLLTAWLDSAQTNTELFNHLLQPHLPQNLWAQAIDKPSTFNAIGDRKLINGDF